MGNPKTQSATSNAKNPNVKLNAPTRDVKCSTALSALLSANNPIALHIAKPLNPNANQSAKNQNVTGNATNPPALNLSANLFAKTLTVYLRLIAVLVPWELLKSLNLSPSLRNLKVTQNVADVEINLYK